MHMIQTIQVPKEWAGVSIGGNGVKSQAMLEALIAAQRALVDQLSRDMPETLSVRWVMHVGGEMFEWNPQVALPKEATEVSCVATARTG